MILALAASLMSAHGDLPRPPLAVNQAVQSWRVCVSDRLNRRAGLARGRVDVHDLASAILAECRPQQDAAFAARAQWVEGLELSQENEAVIQRRNARDVRSMHDSIIFRARRASPGSEQDWD